MWEGRKSPNPFLFQPLSQQKAEVPYNPHTVALGRAWRASSGQAGLAGDCCVFQVLFMVSTREDLRAGKVFGLPHRTAPTWSGKVEMWPVPLTFML